MKIRHIFGSLVISVTVAYGAVLFGGAPLALAEETVRLKDLGRFDGEMDNPLLGYGLVTGLAGTGDSQRNRATRQSLANLLARFNLSIPAEELLSRNTAAVVLTGNLNSGNRIGDNIDVTVTSLGDARSLVGGVLIMAPLSGPDGKVYALAQGPVSVGGYKYDANGNILQKNHPTTGTIPGGAVVEVEVPVKSDKALVEVSYSLSNSDYTTVTRIGKVIEDYIGEGGRVRTKDGSGLLIRVPERWFGRIPDFIAALENLKVVPDVRARVVVNERTGTVVSGGDVKISRVAVTQGDIKIAVTSSPDYFTIGSVAPYRRIGDSRSLSATSVRLEDREDTAYVSPGPTTVEDLVSALVKLKTTTRDIISILKAIKTAGALHADLVVQ